MPQFRQITLSLPAVPSLPPIVLTSTPEGGNWYKRTIVQGVISGRTIPGIPIYGGGTEPYFTGAVVVLVSTDEADLFEEMRSQSRALYDSGEDGSWLLKDEYYYIPSSECTLNSREIISGSTVATTWGGSKSMCIYPVFISIADDHIPYEGGLTWQPLSFTFEELP